MKLYGGIDLHFTNSGREDQFSYFCIGQVNQF